MVAEGVAIVTSILLAFAIQAWWEDRSSRKAEEEVLSALVDELQSNIGSINSALEFRTAMVEPLTELLEASARNSDVQGAELDQLLGSLVWSEIADPATGVFQSLVQGGELGQIEDIALRSRISSLTTVYEDLAKVQSYSDATGRTQLMPILYKNADLAQLTNAQPRSPDGSGSAYPPIPAGPRTNHENLLNDQEFVGVLVNLFWDHYDAIEILKSSKSELDKLIVEIERHLSNEH